MIRECRVFLSPIVPLLLLQRWHEGFSSVDVRVSRCPQGILIEARGECSADVTAFFTCNKIQGHARNQV